MQNKTIRIFSANGQRAQVNVPASQAPRSIVGALSCCCKDSGSAGTAEK